MEAGGDNAYVGKWLFILIKRTVLVCVEPDTAGDSTGANEPEIVNGRRSGRQTRGLGGIA